MRKIGTTLLLAAIVTVAGPACASAKAHARNIDMDRVASIYEPIAGKLRQLLSRIGGPCAGR